MDEKTMSVIIMRMFLNEKYKSQVVAQTGRPIVEILDSLKPEDAHDLLATKYLSFFDQDEKMKLIEVITRDPEVVKRFKIGILPAYLYGYVINEVYDKCNEAFVEFLLYNIKYIGCNKFPKLKKEIKPILQSVLVMKNMD